MAWSGVPWRRLALGSAPPLLLLVDAYVIGPRAAKHAADAEPGDTTHLSRVHVAPRPDWRERIKGQRDPRTGEPGDFQYGELDGTFWARDVWARAHAASGGWLPAMGATDAYWNESAAYATSAEGMWQVESAAYELHSMCLEAGAEVVDPELVSTRRAKVGKRYHIISSPNHISSYHHQTISYHHQTISYHNQTIYHIIS